MLLYRINAERSRRNMQKIPNYTLSNGVEIPMIGMGTWETFNGELCERAVADALEAGYRHFDTAPGYGNEESIGKILRTSGIKREEIFITTKLRNTHHGYDLAKEGFALSMDKLGLDYIDLYIIHWPNPTEFRSWWQEANAGAWRFMEEMYEKGLIRAIGLSNFWPRHIEELLKTARIKPMVNQLHLCPGDINAPATSLSKKLGMLCEGYSPLGKGRIFTVPEMIGLSEKYGKSIAQLCIRWSLQNGFLPLPKTVTPERMTENLDVFDFEIAPEDIEMMTELDGIAGVGQDPDTVTF
jgi:diketogulonate reductase-like aldo/keto reductase